MNRDRITILLLFIISILSADELEYSIPQLHHPTSIYYDDSKFGLKSRSEPLIGDWKTAVIVDDLLVDGRVVCSSCHAGDIAIGKLRNSNRESALCRACHNH